MKAAERLFQLLGGSYRDCFVNAAASLGILSTSMKMDAYSVCTIW
jgi:hypothetical protein